MDFKDAIISITVGKAATIENYKRILEYDQEHILILAKNATILVQGNDLCIHYYSKEELQITGCIKGIMFLDRKSRQ